MNTSQLLSLITDERASSAARIAALEQLGEFRFLELSSVQPGAVAPHLGDLPGTKELRQIMGRPQTPVEVRCQAAVVLARTDFGAALTVCGDLL